MERLVELARQAPLNAAGPEVGASTLGCRAVRWAQARDSQALVFLFARYSDAVCVWLLRVARNAALDHPHEHEREVLALNHLAGLSPGEITSRTSWTEGSVHGAHRRARRAVRPELTSRSVAPATALPRPSAPAD
jgi:hypothetical protein